ncbi:MAG: hypothetical protein NVS2B9_21780 [Myxococcales bacterium]
MTGPALVGCASALSAAAAAAMGAGPGAQAALCLGGALLTCAMLVAARERRRRGRWKEVDRLSRAMFAAAGARRRSRFK